MSVKKITNKLNQRPLLKSAAMLVSAGIIAQIITFLCTLATARLYDPSDFGVLSFFMSLAGLITIFAAGRYDLAIVVEKEEREIVHLVRLCRNLLLFFSLLATLVCTAIYLFQDVFHIKTEYARWLPFLGLAIFSSGFSHVLYMYFTRHQQFKILSASRIIESIALNGITVGLFFTGRWGLLLGYLAGQFAVVIYFLVLFHRRRSEKPIGKLRNTAMKYIDFPRYNVLQGVLDIFQSQSVVLLGSIWFHPLIIGLYALANRLLQVPMGLVVRPISHLFFAQASELHRNNQPIYPLVKKTMRNAFLLSLPVFVVLAIGGPWIFSFLFGAKWEVSGQLARILCAWMLVDLVRAPIAQVPVILGKQRVMLKWTLVGFVISAASVILGSYFFHDKLNEAFLIITGGQIIHCLLVLTICVKLAKAQSHGR
ncbi:MAG: oligosaccharide flippase family protein [Flavobacteriales bacterium]